MKNICIVRPESEQFIYEDYFNFVKEEGKLYFPDTDSYTGFMPDWLSDVSDLCLEVENELNYHLGPDDTFGDIMDSCKVILDTHKKYLAKYGIDLTISDIFSICDYMYSDFSDVINGKYSYDTIEPIYLGYGDPYCEALDVVNYLTGGALVKIELRGYHEYWECYTVDTFELRSYYLDEQEYLEAIVFGELYDYRLYSLDTDDISNISADDLLYGNDEDLIDEVYYSYVSEEDISAKVFSGQKVDKIVQLNY